MKRTVKTGTAILIAIVICLTSVALIAGALNEPTFVLDTVSGAIGEEVELSLSLRNNPGITALKLDVGYSSKDVEIISVEDGGLFGDTVTTSKLTSNPLSVSWCASDSENKADNGVLIKIKFKIRENAESSDIVISYDEDDVFNKNFDNVSFRVVDGRVGIESSPTETYSSTQPQLSVSDPYFEVGSEKGKTNDVVEIPLTLNNNPGITALSVDIGYSSDDLELLAVNDAGLFSESISTSRITSNPITVSWFAADSNNKSNNGVLAVLVFKIKSEAESSDVLLSYDYENVFDNTFSNVRFGTVDGIVTVESAEEIKLGDIDGDGEVGIIDATYIQRYATKVKVPFTDTRMMLGDIDGDGDVTILDATYIQRYATHVKIPFEI